MAADLSALQAAVTNETTVVASAVTLINGIAAQIAAAAQAAAPDPAQLTALSDQLTSSASALAAAVAANTPSAPTT